MGETIYNLIWRLCTSSGGKITTGEQAIIAELVLHMEQMGVATLPDFLSLAELEYELEEEKARSSRLAISLSDRIRERDAAEAKLARVKKWFNFWSRLKFNCSSGNDKYGQMHKELKLILSGVNPPLEKEAGDE